MLRIAPNRVQSPTRPSFFLTPPRTGLGALGVVGGLGGAGARAARESEEWISAESAGQLPADFFSLLQDAAQLPFDLRNLGSR